MGFGARDPAALKTESSLEAAIRLYNGGDIQGARAACDTALALAADPGILQLRGLIALQAADLAGARRDCDRSLALRPDHPPTLLVLARTQRAAGDLAAAQGTLERAITLVPATSGTHIDAQFLLALVCEDRRDLDGAVRALGRVLELAPQRADAAVNLGIVLQESGRADAAFAAFGRAYRARPETFGRIVVALSSARQGRLWLDLDALRGELQRAA